MFGKSARARTIAYPSRWVNETFPPRERRRWLLMTMRLSASSLAGTARTLVAVGSCSDAVMFFAIALPAPRSDFVVSAPPSPSPAPGCADLAGLVVPAAGLPAPSRSPARPAGVGAVDPGDEDDELVPVSPPEG